MRSSATWTMTLIAGVGALASADDEPAPRARPDIVLLMADDMGYSDLGCYGGEIDTPNLDRLAASGVRFTQFYNAARCCPTRASLITGLYPHQADIGDMMYDDGVDGYRGELSASAVTIAEVLGDHGYRTGMTGKWHVTRQLGLWYGVRSMTSTRNWPRQRGFDFFYGTIHACGSFFDPATLVRDNDPVRLTKEDEGYYYTDAIADAAIEFIESTPRERPLFLYVPFTAPHWPLHALEEDVARYAGRYDAGWDVIRDARVERMTELGLIDPRWEVSPRDLRMPAYHALKNQAWQARRMEVYAAQVDRMDQAIGRITAALHKAGRFDDTLLLFLADNGGSDEEVGANWGGLHIPRVTLDGRKVQVGNDPRVMPGGPDTYQSYGIPWANVSNTPFRLYKRFVHEGGIATPLIVHWPNGLVAPGRTSAEAGHIIDVMATCVDAAGAEYPADRGGQEIQPMEGRSLLPVLRDEGGAEDRALFWEHEGNRAVRRGRYKLVAGFGSPWELYDLVEDRTEMHDLASDRDELVEELSDLYEAWAARAGVRPYEEVLRIRRGG